MSIPIHVFFEIILPSSHGINASTISTVNVSSIIFSRLLPIFNKPTRFGSLSIPPFLAFLSQPLLFALSPSHLLRCQKSGRFFLCMEQLHRKAMGLRERVLPHSRYWSSPRFLSSRDVYPRTASVPPNSRGINGVCEVQSLPPRQQYGQYAGPRRLSRCRTPCRLPRSLRHSSIRRPVRPQSRQSRRNQRRTTHQLDSESHTRFARRFHGLSNQLFRSRHKKETFSCEWFHGFSSFREYYKFRKFRNL